MSLRAEGGRAESPSPLSEKGAVGGVVSSRLRLWGKGKSGRGRVNAGASPHFSAPAAAPTHPSLRRRAVEHGTKRQKNRVMRGF